MSNSLILGQKPDPMTVIRQKVALGIKLKGKETRLLEDHLHKRMMKTKETAHHDGRKLSFRKSVEVDPIFFGVKKQNELVNPVRDKTGRLYLGSIDLMTAQNWAKECGAKIGTKEWTAYAKKKLTSGEFSKFQAKPDRRIF